MKFQNPSFKFFLNGRTHRRTSQKQYVAHFFKVGDINTGKVWKGRDLQLPLFKFKPL